MFRRLVDRLKGGSFREIPRHALYADLEANLSVLQDIFNLCYDVKYRRFKLNTVPARAACLVFIENMVEVRSLEEHVLSAILAKPLGAGTAGRDLMQTLCDSLVETLETAFMEEFETAVQAVLNGSAVLLVDGVNRAIRVHVKKLERRAINESDTETVIRGPRDAFVEVLAVNVTLLRRRLQTPALKLEKMHIGTSTQTEVVVAYLEGVAEPKIVAEVKNRLGKIDIDGVLESAYIEEFIEDVPWSPFPQIDSTERPDKVAAGLLEGQVAVLVDNTPFVLLMPVTFVRFLYAAEDYYSRAIYATFTRLVRFLSLNVALILPAAYVAIVTFHQELLPTNLLLSIAAGREPVPFPAFLEALLMETTFEILREAGIRLPRPVGQATSIVGALVIGNAAVSAGLVSPAMVIVVSLTALASFIIPTPSGAYAVRILRFPLMFFAAALGFFGVMVALMAILTHLCTLRSFGVPYLSLIAPIHMKGLKDSFVRVPWWMMAKRR